MKLAVVASGWHFPAQFYEALSKQTLPKDWEVDFFCVSHRDPSQAREEKKGRTFSGPRAYLDEKLYTSVISKEDIEKLGWKYVEEPNTIGDWGNSNQWLAKNDWKQYDLFLFTHDDNLILNDSLFLAVIDDDSYPDWEILCNSAGMPAGSIRGSFEFFKKSMLESIGGQFDLSETTLTREGHTKATEDIHELYDWNSTVYPLQRYIEDNHVAVGYLSPAYRVSAFCIEGERGYISNTHGQNTEREDVGLKFLKDNGII